jgi:WS/DGAT/MGAT family acyltransferase
MHRLSGLDASFLYLETSSQLLHVCGLIVVDPSTMPGGYTFDKLAAELARRVKLLPAFRRKLHAVPFDLDHPIWVEDSDFDVANHLSRVAVPAPGGRRELAELCATLAAQPIDRSRPLWEMWVIEGLTDGTLALLVKMHHAGVDGVTGASLIGYLCGPRADAPPGEQTEPDNPDGPPSDLSLIMRGVGTFARKPVEFARLLPRTLGIVPRWLDRSVRGSSMPAPFTAPRTSFNGTISSRRSVAYARVGLAEVKAVKNAFGVTVNDVVLAMSSGALRRYLSDRDDLPEAALVGIVPVSTHGVGAPEGTNRVSGMFTCLATNVDDPAERLATIARSNRVGKEHHASIGPNLLRDWARLAAPTTLAAAARLYSFLRLAEKHPVVHNLVISNVPGPQLPAYLLGCRVTGMYPLGPVFHGAGLNITVLSNGFDGLGHVDIGLIACRNAAPDLWALADAMPEALEELLSAAPAG